jgi:hypothetical protein
MNAEPNDQDPEKTPVESSSRSKGCELRRFDPRQFLTRSRLDIVLKYLFFRSLSGAADRAQWEAFYRKHIQDRTGGTEPPDNFQEQDTIKGTVDDYVLACETLFRSFQRDGFDPSYPIPVSVSQKLLNGAHRIACALATDNTVVVAPVRRGTRPPWGFQWFLDRGYPHDLKAALLYHYAHLTTRAVGVMILWGPAVRHWQEILKGLKKKVGIVGWLDLSFEENPAAFESIVHDIYSLQWQDLEQANIRRKTILLNQSQRVFRVVLVEDLFDHPRRFLKKLTTCRNTIRSKLDRIIPEDAFCTCHASSNERESNYLIELLLGPGSRKHQMMRVRGQPRLEFAGWLFKLANELERHGLSREEICIVGSSPLEVIGIRNSTDLDITVTSGLRKRFSSGITHLNDWLDIVTKGYARALDHPPISDDQLIQDSKHHFWFRGFKFADVDIVLRRKARQRRPKDLADVDAARKFFLLDAGERAQGFAAHGPGIDLIAYLVGRERDSRAGRL